MKKKLVKIYWIINEFGFDVVRFLKAINMFPNYLIDLFEFRKQCSAKLTYKPCLHDSYQEGGSAKGEYFWMDLTVARWIYDAAPEKHVDIGSRIDGFVAHVASFRQIEVFDVRPITASIPGITFNQADLMDENSIKPFVSEGGYCDSISCLHALEHFGLGRYGDPVNAEGYAVGLRNMATLLKPQGLLYLATPMGREKVEFNANWIFKPKNILNVARKNGMQLQSMHVFDVQKGLVNCLPNEWERKIDFLSHDTYNLVVMQFRKD